ncbi:MAG: CobD/CbiB family protein [Proteobacteria bacterium]|nr:CobD/CbiB family protein [Pseudomonadota bacterium]
MTFLSILFALLLEQLHPLRADNPINGGLHWLAQRIEGWFNAGQSHHGKMAWFAAIIIVMLPTTLVYWLCAQLGFLAALLWNIAIVYATLGLRRYSHYFTSIQLALSAGDEDTARTLLSEWTGQDASALDAGEISRIAVEAALLTTHRNVFGVFFWFLMPIGPAGAVMYRMAEYLAETWNAPEHLQDEAFGSFAARAFYWIDWIPARLTAVAFAVIGNFEDAIYAWRNFAGRWHDEAIGIILASGGGAMGVRLGAPEQSAANVLPLDAALVDVNATDIEAPPGDAPTPRALQSTVGLVWRALLLWMLLLLLLSAAVWLG